MPAAAPRPCRAPGCGLLVTSDKRGFCDAHESQRSSWMRRVDRSGSTTKRGYGWSWQQLRQRILTRDNGLCQKHLAEGFVVLATDVDHKIRKEDGGTDDDSNLWSLCRDCHKHKTATEGRGVKKCRK